MACSTGYIKAECPICFESFKTPKLITCGHTFCLPCIKQYIGDKTVDFSCPVCNQKVKIPHGGVEGFVTNFLAVHSPSSSQTLENLIDKENTSSTQSRGDHQSNNLKPDETKHSHGCPNHNERKIDYFCKTCHLGMCSKCVLMNHKDHEFLDLDCQETRTEALGEMSNFEQFVRKKIEDFEKYQTTLQDSCEKLKYFCDESCSKVTKQTDKIIADLREKCEKTKKDIREKFRKNDKHLSDIIAHNTKHIENLKTVLKSEISPLSEGSSLNILQSLPKLKDLTKQCNSIKIVVPKMTYFDWTKSDFIPNEKILGSLQQKLYIAGLDSEESPQCFMFDSNDIMQYEVYYSKDKVLDLGLVWSCCILRRDDGYSSIYVTPLEDDNKYLEYINIKYKLTLINSIDEHKSIIQERDYKFIPGGWDDLHRCMPWSKLIDPCEGLINSEGQFNVRFEIIHVYAHNVKPH